MPGPGSEAELRFYEELNDFLPEARRKVAFSIPVRGARSVKDAIESTGVPHTEVDLILVDGRSVGFDHLLHGGERVAVYPMFEALDIAPVVRLRPRPLREPRFIVDGHLGRLARNLRLAGFDTLYDPAWDDAAIVQRAAAERRTILTRDKAMLRRSAVDRGYFVRNTAVGPQVAEVVRALQLESLLQPFTRCRECNTPLEDITIEEASARVPPRVAASHQRFKACPGCGRVYWEGSHYARMAAMLAALRR